MSIGIAANEIFGIDVNERVHFPNVIKVVKELPILEARLKLINI